MNPLFFLSALTGLAAADGATRVEVQARDSGEHLTSFGPYYIDENYSIALLASGSVPYRFNKTDNSIYVRNHQYTEPRVLRLFNDELVFVRGNSSLDDTTVVRLGDNGLFNLNGDSHNFWVCRPLAWDPSGVPTQRSLIGLGYYTGDAPEGCNPVQIASVPY